MSLHEWVLALVLFLVVRCVVGWWQGSRAIEAAFNRHYWQEGVRQLDKVHPLRFILTPWWWKAEQAWPELFKR